MAQQEGLGGSHTFDKSLQQNISNFYEPKNTWVFARNAINNSATGDLGEIGNEPANDECARAPYTIIGTIHLFADKWAVYSTNGTDSEIGLWEEELCKYTRIVNDKCLNFKLTNLITGSSKENSDCTYQLYWQDALNPDRTMCIGDPKDWPTASAPAWPCVSYIQICKDENNIVIPSPNPEYTPRGCITCEDTEELDCDAIRLAPLIEPPCLRIERGQYGGEIINGSYYVVAAYTVDGEKVTDYSTPSNVQGIFHHDNVSSSLDIYIDSIDQNNFTEFELVLVSIANQQVSARRVGIYSVYQNKISLDAIDNRWESVPIENIPIRTPVPERCDLMSDNQDYLLRVGPYNKLDFNYQPLANLIRAKWQSVEYPANYYAKGGNQTGYMRDEVYCFWIRWVYNTGDKSASYHIPGRPPRNFTNALGTFFEQDDFTVNCPDNIEALQTGFQDLPKVFEVFNTAAVTNQSPLSFNPPLETLSDGGQVIAEGDMGYWESTEKYPNNPDIWNTYNTNTQWDLCGEPIRHHKFPEDDVNGSNIFTQRYRDGGQYIRVMGVKFENISFPIDNTGAPITNIIGYEILRGTREGNRSIISKGIINRMGAYDIPGSGKTGLFPNYPYNDINADPFLSTSQTVTNLLGIQEGYEPITDFPDYVYTYHGPDTQFKNPFLSMKEMKIYGEVNCDVSKKDSGVEGRFQFPEKHPKHKLLTNASFLISFIVGIGAAVIAQIGKRRITSIGVSALGVPTGAAASVAANAAGIATDLATYGLGGNIAGSFVGVANEAYLFSILGGNTAAAATPGAFGGGRNIEFENTPFAEAPVWLRGFQAAPSFLTNTQESTDLFLRLIERFSPYQQYALTYRSHAFYNYWLGPNRGKCQTRRYISDAIYVDPQLQDFSTSFIINNLFRQRLVAFRISNTLDTTQLTDNSKIRASDAFQGIEITPDTVITSFKKTSAASHYVGLKQRLRNQYGQVDGTMQMPTGTCITIVDNTQTIFTSPVIFGGDVYVTRYTEKNTMPFFYDWLYGQDDGYEFNYNLKKNVLYPRYWANLEKFDLYDFIDSVQTELGNLVSGSGFNDTNLKFPTTSRVLNDNGGTGFFCIKNAYFYLFNSGVRDFFVESEINVGYRDWGDLTTQRHYDPYAPYTDLDSLFNVEIIKSGNYYKYDFSLSISRLYNNYISWGNMQTRDYDPEVSQKCYSYRPNTIIYSNVGDWDRFVPNNYKNYTSRPTGIKNVNKNGIVIFFETESPIQYQGVDTLQTDLNTKITLGDGGLFSQPRQSVNNVDAPYEYASCQSSRSPINTPAGLFWISANQGKIYSFGGQGAMEISSQDLKWWFATYLPFKLLVDFPDFTLKDNPVIGIGCQSIYNNQDSLLYFCKKDYRLKQEYKGRLTYIQNNLFLLDNEIQVTLGDKRYFDNASWTLSYDPKTRGWLSWHDWYPELLLPGKRTFMSTKTNPAGEGGIWVHNQISNLYCNYYGVDYPFEIEFRVHTGQNVQTLRSVEYIMEAYKYSDNETDRYHFLDYNFDEAVVYNTEQVSGLLKLNLTPKNNPVEITKYPKINLSSIDILYSKVENKYRFDQFWDITDDRGEYTNAQRTIWNTEPNGYIKSLNPLNLNYQKNLFQRKKFRHYVVTVLLRKLVSGNKKMLLMIHNVKNQNSPR